MSDQKNLRIIFTDKADVVFDDIVKAYGIQETDEEFYDYIESDGESREMILRDTVEVMARQMISEKKLAGFLAKYLGISEEIAEKIIIDFKTRLMPLVLIYPDEKFDDPAFSEEVSKKVFEDRVKWVSPPPPIIKKVEIVNVEENAEKIKERGRRGQDVYRETVE